MDFAAGLRLDDRSRLFLRGSAFEHGNLRSRRKLVQMFGFASRREVEIGVIAQNSGSLDGIALVVLRELLQAIVGRLIHQIALLDPTLEAAGGAHAGEALLVLQYFHAFAIFYDPHAVVDGGDLIAQRGLDGRDIVYFEHAVAPAIAGRQRQYDGQCERHDEACKMR